MSKVDLFPVKEAEPLTVRLADTDDPRHFWIEGMSEGRHFEDRYFCVSGHFGNYGPYVFAAAPDLLEALKELDAVGVINPTGSRKVSKAVAKLRAAIAKAEGRS
ncbi:hypothetical protein CN138_08985 [Sinorhizobium meliloti]|uniref:hypothetical protein n=1 Tax=Rhizobium meliloti TaxID=382 RepID=UPI000FD3C37E|nr:hypothetical protein [Sinorhizobium meliloti]RVL48454.1 hypothetical protein CN145_23105 [Sinorhizobium meliloti]RVL72388.1 hypothetical protein CN138_08985 [Sinorhizobium meliloti]